MGWQDEAQRPGWFGRLHLSWPMLLLAGWLLYEFTAQPGLAALVACAKFGWGDVRTAFWLRRVDPDRKRGQTCFWCYLTYGIWKAVVMATTAAITIGVLINVLDRVRRQAAANDGFSPVHGGAVVTAALGFSFYFPTACIALWSAWCNGVRIWLGHSPNRARKERFWPPHHGWINLAPLVFSTIFIMMVGAIILLDMVLIGIAEANGVPPRVFLAGFLAILFTGLLAIFCIGFAVEPLFARSPQECWIGEEGEEVYQGLDTQEGVNEA